MSQFFAQSMLNNTEVVITTPENLIQRQLLLSGTIAAIPQTTLAPSATLATASVKAICFIGSILLTVPGKTLISISVIKGGLTLLTQDALISNTDRFFAFYLADDTAGVWTIKNESATSSIVVAGRTATNFSSSGELVTVLNSNIDVTVVNTPLDVNVNGLPLAVKIDGQPIDVTVSNVPLDTNVVNTPNVAISGQPIDVNVVGGGGTPPSAQAIADANWATYKTLANALTDVGNAVGKILK